MNDRIRARWMCLGLSVSLLAVFASAQADGDRMRGKDIAQNGTPHGAIACATCHGLEGQGNADAGYPRLASLDSAYIAHELESFRNGTRRNAVMQPIAARLSEQDTIDIALWYSEQKARSPSLAITVSQATLRRGENLAKWGESERGLPACFSCHGPSAEGIPPNFPRLGGQYSNYLATQLSAFKSGQRQNDHENLMRSVAAKLSDQDAQAVSAYLAQLNPAGQKSAPLSVTATSETSSSHFKDERPFTPPKEEDIPSDEFGDMVRLGENLFVNTQTYARQYVGNALNCSNCHLDRGRKFNSAPMWAAYVYYPAYRKKNNKVNTMQDRIEGCFRFSENGHPPAPNSKEMTALVTYFSWLAREAPTGADMKARGYPRLVQPASKPDPKRGATIYAAQCAYCHGVNGEGTQRAEAYAFPPLWGPHSFNGGAGMHRVETAAAFIKSNMPFGKGGSLSDQDAWDVAAFVDSHPRPADPRTKNPTLPPPGF